MDLMQPQVTPISWSECYQADPETIQARACESAVRARRAMVERVWRETGDLRAAISAAYSSSDSGWWRYVRLT